MSTQLTYALFQDFPAKRLVPLLNMQESIGCTKEEKFLLTSFFSF